MSDFLPSGHPRMGTLELEHVFEYYDSPVLFSAKNDLDGNYLAVAVDGSGADSTYLYVPTSHHRLLDVRTGLVSLRTAFQQPEVERVFAVTVSPSIEGAPTVDELSSSQIPLEWLPDADEYLAEPAETARAFSPEFLARAAAREERQLVGLEVDQPTRMLRTEIPFRTSGSLMTEFQELVDALAGPADFALVDLQAASFVIVATPLVGDGLFAEASAAVSAVQNLLTAAGGDHFGEYLAGLNRRKQAHVRDFFLTLSDADTGLTFFAATAEGVVQENAISLDRVRDGLKQLRASKELPDETLRVTGFLISLNHARRSFGVVESGPTGGRRQPRRYGGKFDPAVEIEGVASGQTILYRFTILREAQVADFDDDRISFTYRLMEMSLAGDQHQLGAGSQ